MKHFLKWIFDRDYRIGCRVAKYRDLGYSDVKIVHTMRTQHGLEFDPSKHWKMFI